MTTELEKAKARLKAAQLEVAALERAPNLAAAEVGGKAMDAALRQWFRAQMESHKERAGLSSRRVAFMAGATASQITGDNAVGPARWMTILMVLGDLTLTEDGNTLTLTFKERE